MSPLYLRREEISAWDSRIRKYLPVLPRGEGGARARPGREIGRYVLMLYDVGGGKARMEERSSLLKTGDK
jgi:hypothetical protein